MALKTFRHLHALSLRFHLERQTGGMSRSIEKGTAAIEFMLGYLLTQLLPTVFELVLVAAVIALPFAIGVRAEAQSGLTSEQAADEIVRLEVPTRH